MSMKPCRESSVVLAITVIMSAALVITDRREARTDLRDVR